MEQKLSVDQISEKHVSTESIMSILSDLYYRVEIDGGDIVVKDDYNVIIRVDSERKMISFSIYFKNEDDDCDMPKMYRHVAEANDRVAFVKCCVDSEGDLYTEYYLCYFGGITSANIVHSFRKFISTTRTVIKVIQEGFENDD